MEKINKVHLYGFDFVSDLDYGTVTKWLLDREPPINKNDELPLVITPNAHQIVQLNLKKNACLKEQLIRSAMILPDGQPIVLLGNIIGKPITRRLAGSELFPILWKYIKDQDKSSFFVVPQPDLVAFFEKEHHYNKSYCPPFFDPIRTPASIDDIVSHCLQVIQTHHPDFVIVGLGFPKQEILALTLISELNKARVPGKMPWFLLLGASFEFYAGVKKAAPAIWKKLGLEWLYRFMQEPGRLWKRYTIGLFMFLCITIAEIFRLKKT